LIGAARDDDDRQKGVDGIEALESIPTVFDRHVQVDRQDIDADATANCDRLVAIERMQHIESFAAKGAGERYGHGGVVVTRRALFSHGRYREGCCQDSIFVEVYLHNECAFNGLGFAYLGPCGKTKLPLQVLSAKLSVFNPHPAIASRSS
jgi:hypothetical protein